MIARRAWPHAAVLAAAVTLPACGDGPNGPTPPPPDTSVTVSAITPSSGPTLGGTPVTITGTNFAAGAAVTIGGVAATSVQVPSATTITAVTGQHAIGAGDVTVIVAGRSGSLPGAFTFIAPSGPVNAPPAIAGITSRSLRPGVPTRFADLDDAIALTATVIDAETPADQLRYEWSADSGTFSGAGREVTWRAPAEAGTPAIVRLTLAVVETYPTTDSQGLPATAEHRVTGAVDIRLHASAKEVRDLAVEFLLEFSQQRVPPDQMVRNFSDSCPGKAAERGEVAKNQAELTITSYSVETNPQTEIAFGGACRNRGRTGDACSYVQVRWDSTYKADGYKEVATGVDQVSAIYENNRWRLCDSDFIGSTRSGLRFRK